MNKINADDAFLGTWQLQPNLSDYAFGQAPAEGVYRISRYGEGYKFDIAWTMTEGQQFETGYLGTPDGEQYPYENSQVAEAVSLTRVDELTLDSESFKGGRRIAYACRELIKNGCRMRVTQSGETADGVEFSNIAYYQKVD
ncbi:MAG: hypothetical protein ACK2T4_05550 [Candidatus Promineifilaceae bacterium]|jgi:hypothetical protein